MKNLIIKLNKLFICSVAIPSVAMIASFVTYFALLYSFLDIKKLVTAAVIFGVFAICCSAALFRVNSKKFELIKDLGIVDRKRGVIIDSVSPSAGMILTAAAVFYTLIKGALGVVDNATNISSQLMFIPVFTVALVFVPSLLPPFLTQRKIKIYFTEK